MSRIYFHTKDDGSAELRGSERAYAGQLCNDLALAILRPWYQSDTPLHPSSIRGLLPTSSYVARTSSEPDLLRARVWASSFEAWFRAGFSEAHFIIPGRPTVDTFSLSLNTATIMGSDPIKLLARLHAQSEIHCYVEGEDRAWLADMICDGRKTNVLRPNQGWEDIATLLALRDDEPVVCSYSVCEGFPNADMAIEGGYCDNLCDITDELYDEFYELEDDVQWDYAMKGLRRQGPRTKHGLRIQPSGWGEYRFGHTLSAFDIDAYLTEQEVS